MSPTSNITTTEVDMTTIEANTESTTAVPDDAIGQHPDRRPWAARRARSDAEPLMDAVPHGSRRRVRRRRGLKRQAAFATGALVALAIAAPFANATTASAAAYVPAFDAPPPSQGALAIGPTLIGTTFNGPTSIITTTR